MHSARQLVGERVVHIDERSLPFPTASFDVVAAINFLEHIEDDDTFFAEMVRVLKPGGEFLFMAPKGEHGRPGFALKRVLGFTADQEGFGHARDGYPPARARDLMQRHGLTVLSVDDYCRIFTESLEDLLNYAYHRKAMEGKQPAEQDFHGDTAPDVGRGAGQGGDGVQGVLRHLPRCSAAGPCSTSLIPFSPGYMMVARARQGRLRCAGSSAGWARRRCRSGRSAACATRSSTAGPTTGASSSRAAPDSARGGSASSTSPAGTSR